MERSPGPVVVRTVADVLAVFESRRAEQGIGKTKLADRAGYSKRIYGDWARGDINNPSMSAVLDYAAVLGLELLIGSRS
jgi:transcriptional regulator with XRE-family HTH domain